MKAPRRNERCTWVREVLRPSAPARTASPTRPVISTMSTSGDRLVGHGPTAHHVTGDPLRRWRSSWPSAMRWHGFRCWTAITDTVTGLGDAGAHLSMACDVSAYTFALAHWARDRTRGERLPVELIVRKATSVPATIWGMHDRGTLTKRADINVIDFENLASGRPELRRDLPAGGSRFVQPAHGCIATMVGGSIIRRNDEDTGARPGRLIRRPRVDRTLRGQTPPHRGLLRRRRATSQLMIDRHGYDGGRPATPTLGS
jgi:hypothetical protein